MSDPVRYSPAKPILAAVVVSIVSYGMIRMLGPQIVQPRSDPVVCLDAGRDLLPRVAAGTCIIALLVMMAGLTVFARGLIARHAPHSNGVWLRRTWRIAWLGFGFTLLISLRDAHNGLVDSWISIRTLPTVIRADWFFHFLNGFGAIPTVFVVSAAASTVSALNRSVDARDLEAVRSVVHDTRILLYGISSTLVVAVIEIFSVSRWAAINLDAIWSSHASVIAVAVSGGLGGIYSILLAALFGPVLLDQQRAIESLARDTCGPASSYKHRLEWMDREGLHPRWAQHSGKLFAVLGPFLTSTALPAVWSRLLS